ncbi:MAG: hypothetical protein AAGD92_08085 [Pseudomonadota bacterium]
MVKSVTKVEDDRAASYDHENSDSAKPSGLKAKIIDAAAFWGVIFVTAFALAAIALLTPLVLALSAIVSIIEPKRVRSAWRPVNA